MTALAPPTASQAFGNQHFLLFSISANQYLRDKSTEIDGRI
jgi:hypothetical protein